MCSNSKDSYFFCVFFGSAFNTKVHKSTWIEVNLFSRALDAWWDDPEVLMGALTNQNFCVGTSLIFR